ncbi:MULTISPECIES: hypothetical protein [unclassified Nonomuraea]
MAEDRSLRLVGAAGVLLASLFLSLLSVAPPGGGRFDRAGSGPRRGAVHG